MTDDDQRQEAATSGDLPRHVATSGDSEYSLSIEDALARYEAAGLPRNRRSVQRYCANGALDAHRIETQFGEKFLITAASVERHIAYINEVRPVATSRDLSRPVATDVARENMGAEPRDEAATSGDKERQAATATPVSRPVAAPDERYMSRLEGEVEFLRGQITVKDGQIKELTERARETNVLINGLQRLLGPLLSAPDRARSDEQDHGGQHLQQ